MKYHVFRIAAILATIPVVIQAQDARGQPGTLVITSPSQAVAAALAHSPALREANASRQAVHGDGMQAELRPNPEVSLSVENFGGLGGRGAYRGTTAAETTLGLSQRLELGGKRTARIGLAGHNEGVATLDYEVARLNLARDVVTALVEATAAARAVDIERERARLAAGNVRIAHARVEAGKESLLQQRRAEVSRTTAELAVERARREAETAVRSLAVAIGVAQIELPARQSWFDEVSSTHAMPMPPDPLERLRSNPDYVRLDAAIGQRRADMALQQANAVPDITLQGQVRRFQETRATAFIVGATVPLPVSDRNQGGIARAAAELARAEAEVERGRLTMVAALTAAERQMESASQTVRTLRRNALPAAQQAARLATEGYAEGKFTFVEALEAQRALTDTRAQLNDALREFHNRHAEIGRLRGQQPPTIQPPGVR